MILLMTQPDTFHAASTARKQMEETLFNTGVMRTLKGLRQLPPFEGQLLVSELPLAAGQLQRTMVGRVSTHIFSST